MSKIQRVREKVKVLKEIQKASLSLRVSSVDKLIDATNVCNDLKSFIRESLMLTHGESKEKRIKTFLTRLFKTNVLTDVYSNSKYYPDFLMSKCPNGHLTTIARLVSSDIYIFDLNDNKFKEDKRDPITYNNYNHVLSYGTKIESMNKNTKFYSEKDTLKRITLNVNYTNFPNPVIDTMLYLGVELEVARKHNTPEDICLSILNNLNINFKETGKYSFAILKQDSSIPIHGFEIVSAPATLKYHHTAWDKFFDNDAKHLRSFTTLKCGMHVHFSRSAMDGRLHIGKLLVFYNHAHNRKFITDIAGRTENSYTSFKEKKLTDASILTGERNQSVNLATPKSKTIEIRIFKGNVKREGFFKNLEFVHAAVEFTRQASMGYKTNSKIAEVQLLINRKAEPISYQKANNSVKGLTFEEFLIWVQLPENLSSYPYLTKWLKSRKYTDNKDIKLVDDKTHDKQFTYSQFLNDVA